MCTCSVIHADLSCQFSIIVSAKEYLQSESPEDKRSREESAWLLENQMYSKLVDEKDQLLKDKQKELERETNQRKELEKHLERGKREQEEKHKETEKKRNELEEELRASRVQLKERDRTLERLESEGKEREKRLEENDKQLGERDELLKERDRQVEDVKNENIKLAQQICDLNTEVERQRNELSVKTTERGEISEAEPKLPIRRRRSREHLPSMGGETPDTDPPLPQDEGSTVVPVVRRRRSMDYPPHMGGESSSPDPPVSPSVSELRLVLLGRTGAGRRAAGNTILGREEFRAQDSPSAVTQRSRRREGDVCGRRLVLVDTPDWFCPGLSLEEMRQDVGLCVRLSAPGPHAFLLVVPVEPSEGEERGAMERMEDMFGEGCWGHTVILFTHDDSLREQSMEEFLQTGSQDLQQLVEKCGNRYHVLNIKDRAHGTQVPELLHQVEEMVAGNRESFYSSQTYQEAEAQVREMEGKIQREREEKIQREETERKEKFETELQNSLKKIEGVIQEHEGDIRTLSHRTSELERQVKEERDEEKKRELERELKRETDRREEMERKLERFREKRENERREREERHRQEMEEFRENYEGEARVEAERNLMKVVLPELQRSIMISHTKMQRDFSRQMQEKNRDMEVKDREMERLKYKLIDLSTKFLDEVHEVSAWNKSHLGPEEEGVEEEEEEEGLTETTPLLRGETEQLT
ncbi:calponin homology domain-containing protein DDB_G0272472-like isoform X2 [Osmerus eperlanus]|uniref:calponin homology domain-containing protein DDB_G0272472-like isoform X2 n=1 Tax=Osmerus eperlanus TaxID=29151 RepID=UPI002E1045D8